MWPQSIETTKNRSPLVRENSSLSPMPKDATHMLFHWQSHQEYLLFIHETKVHLGSSQLTRRHLEFAPGRDKLHLLDIDPVIEYLSAFYSPVGRPAKNPYANHPPLILIVIPGFTSLTFWIHKLRAD